MIGTAAAADLGGTGHRIAASTPFGRRRLRTRRALAPPGNSALSPRRQKRGADSELAPSVREPAENVRAVLRAIAGIAVIVALMAVGTAEAGGDGGDGTAPPCQFSVFHSGARAGRSLRGLARVPGRALSRHVLRRDTGTTPCPNNTYGGTATCDWLSKMAAAAAEHPQAAVLVFSGNAFTTCMDGVTLRSPEYYDLYTTDTEQAIGDLQRGGRPCLLGRDPDRRVLGGRVGPPRRHLPTAGSCEPSRSDLRGRRRHRGDPQRWLHVGSCPA